MDSVYQRRICRKSQNLNANMEKQIVLREGEWRMEYGEHIHELYVGNHYLATVDTSCGPGEYCVALFDPNSEMIYDFNGTLDEAKAKAISDLTDWLRSIATITE